MIDHDNLAVTDNLRLVGELEHVRRHAVAAAVSPGTEEALPYLMLAAHAQKARREFMKSHFPVEEKDWCLVKTAATLLQLMDELAGGDEEELKTIKHLVDEIVEVTTGKDISGCQACRADLEEVEE